MTSAVQEFWRHQGQATSVGERDRPVKGFIHPQIDWQTRDRQRDQ